MAEEKRYRIATTLRYFWQTSRSISFSDEDRDYIEQEWPGLLQAWERYQASEATIDQIVNSLRVTPSDKKSL